MKLWEQNYWNEFVLNDEGIIATYYGEKRHIPLI